MLESAQARRMRTRRAGLASADSQRASGFAHLINISVKGLRSMLRKSSALPQYERCPICEQPANLAAILGAEPLAKR